MATTWQHLVARAHARGANGELFPLANGQETTAELRRLCAQLVAQCPCHRRYPHCPFHCLSQHPPGAVRRLIETMPANQLREMFVLELIYRTAGLEQEEQARGAFTERLAG